ncbi:uncharacterized protein F4822DRAFT_434249 [Hypoxylon trugodes]|uniref:uncharacterized protein n=1 Tax=Hypoxylon trugodes TaxID=326681 RepID=UPI002192CAAC|nr:uncharacterized protein F4822DRAFT_434249 [Hypoxylon trugodes]KAI1384313.1 hypothetical protein F4822DRAFT_434249 [Hypoxylon trugodes]
MSDLPIYGPLPNPSTQQGHGFQLNPETGDAIDFADDEGDGGLAIQPRPKRIGRIPSKMGDTLPFYYKAWGLRHKYRPFDEVFEMDRWLTDIHSCLTNLELHVVKSELASARLPLTRAEYQSALSTYALVRTTGWSRGEALSHVEFLYNLSSRRSKVRAYRYHKLDTTDVADETDDKTNMDDWVAERIIWWRRGIRGREYLVKWVGHLPTDNTWVPARELKNRKTLIARFKAAERSRPLPSVGGLG